MTASDPFGFTIPDEEYADYLDRLHEQQANDEAAEAAYAAWLSRCESAADPVLNDCGLPF